jgi:hypothetical protein
MTLEVEHENYLKGDKNTLRLAHPLALFVKSTPIKAFGSDLVHNERLVPPNQRADIHYPGGFKCCKFKAPALLWHGALPRFFSS